MNTQKVVKCFEELATIIKSSLFRTDKLVHLSLFCRMNKSLCLNLLLLRIPMVRIDGQIAHVKQLHCPTVPQSSRLEKYIFTVEGHRAVQTRPESPMQLLAI